MDIGADKQADYLNLEKEENPALGYRAIRICLSQPEIFKVQLRALFRAPYTEHFRLCTTVLSLVEEVMRIKEIVKEVKAELKSFRYTI